MQEIFELLEPLKEATIAMSARNSCSAHTVLCSIESVRECINKVDEDVHSSTENRAADKMGAKFNKYYSDNVLPKQFIIAHILDPRIKLLWAKSQDSNNSRQSTNVTMSEQYRNVIRVTYNKYFRPKLLNASGEFINNIAEDLDELLESPTPGLQKSKSIFDKQLDAVKRVTGMENGSAFLDELDKYLNDITCDDTSNEFNILLWWKRNEERYPNVANMARCILCIQGSSVASESAFSTSGRVITDQRGNLHAQTITKIMVCEDWLRAFDEYNWKYIVHVEDTTT